MSERYDVVVIGAGLGGLTAAALLARAGRKTLVVERNTSVGGAASTYKVKDLVVEAALHETSDGRNPADPKHDVLQQLDILDSLEWVCTNALYEVRGGPVGAPLLLPGGYEAAEQTLAARFPDLREGFRTALGAVRDAAQPAASRAHTSADEPTTVAAQFSKLFDSNEAAKCALAANLMLYHDDPRTMEWQAFASMQGSYLAQGPCFIRGGSQRLSNGFRRAIQNAGGRVLLKRNVNEIRTDAEGRPVAVVHATREGDDPVEVLTSAVVSNAAPVVLASLLPARMQDGFKRAYAGRPVSTSVFAATLGLSVDPRQFGLTSYTTVLLPDWMQRLDDFAESARLVPEVSPERAPPMMVTNYSALDSGLGGPPYPVAVLGLDHIENWAGLNGTDYVDQRTRVLDGIVAVIDREFPGFAGAVTSKALNTAKSMGSYLNAPAGAVYGFAPVPRDSRENAYPSARTPLPGLVIAGAAARYGGFNGAIQGGAEAARCILQDN